MPARQLLAVLLVAGCGAGESSDVTRCGTPIGADALHRGLLIPTGVETDLALSGAGFLVFARPGSGDLVFTRDGRLTLGADGRLIHPDGPALMLASDAPGSVEVPARLDRLAAHATTELWFVGNLPSETSVPAADWDPANRHATSNYAVYSEIFGDTGLAFPFTVFFRRNEARSWDWHALIFCALDACPEWTEDGWLEIAGGTLEFDSTGRVAAETQSGESLPEVGLGALHLSWCSRGANGKCHGGRLTASDGPAQLDWLEQDGYPEGQLRRLQVDANGTLRASYSNAQTRELGRLAVALVPAPTELLRQPNHLLAPSAAAGAAVFAPPGEAGRGLVVVGAYEQLLPETAECGFPGIGE